MQAFVRIAERQSFTQASEDLRIPRATITNLIKRMEQRLGARLLERTTRTVRLTHDGEAHYRRCVRLIADLEEAEGSFRNAAPKGSPARELCKGRSRAISSCPRCRISWRNIPTWKSTSARTTRLVDLVREGVDCATACGKPAGFVDGGPACRPIGAGHRASPAYLAKHGEPKGLDALSVHRAVNYISSGTGKAVPMEFTVDGRVTAIQLAATVSVTGADLYTGASVAGLEPVQVPRYRVAAELDGRLQVVLADVPPPPMPVSVLYPQNRQLSSRVRVFVQWLREVFEVAGDGGR
ncbi:LysR family transcriptional regulator [Cupriavidus basilensis]